MVLNTDSAVPLVFPLRGSAPRRRSVDTSAAGANTTNLLPVVVVVSTGEALRSGTAVGEEVVSPRWPGDCAAAAAAAMRAAVAYSAVGAVASLDASFVDDPAAGCDLDHRRGAWCSVYRGGPAHGLHLQPRFCHRSHGQRLVRGLRHSSYLVPTENSPLEQSQPPGFSRRNHLSLRINKPHRGIGALGRSVLYVLFHGQVLSLDVSLVSLRPRKREQNIQRQAQLFLSRAIQTLFLPCHTLLLVSWQQSLLAPATLKREIQYPL